MIKDTPFACQRNPARSLYTTLAGFFLLRNYYGEKRVEIKKVGWPPLYSSGVRRFYLQCSLPSAQTSWRVIAMKSGLTLFYLSNKKDVSGSIQYRIRLLHSHCSKKVIATQQFCPIL